MASIRFEVCCRRIDCFRKYSTGICGYQTVVLAMPDVDWDAYVI
jgi:hypothetical protein